MSLPTPHRSLSPARLVRAAGRLQHTQHPHVFESKISAQLAGLILYVMHMLVCVCVRVCVFSLSRVIAVAASLRACVSAVCV